MATQELLQETVELFTRLRDRLAEGLEVALKREASNSVSGDDGKGRWWRMRMNDVRVPCLC